MPTFFGDQVFVSPFKWKLVGRDPSSRRNVFHWLTAISILQRDDLVSGIEYLYHDGLGITISRSEALSFQGMPLAIKIPPCPNCGDQTRLLPGYRTFRFVCSNYPECGCWIAPTASLLIADCDASLAPGILELSRRV
ncbi:MAG TPA: hypothetical protein DDZ51_17650 [Planctomycetaceae bacterium]|nr:hypothetical protein [Planctomycetaceae bacterium]